MAKRRKPADPITNTIQLGMMMFEAQAVISMRLMGMAGLWSVSPQENQRMLTEKVQAIGRATSHAGIVGMRGGTPDQMTAAAIAPIRRVTRANSKRLVKNGPKLG